MSITSQRHYMILLLVASDTDNRIPNDGSILRYLLKSEREEPDLTEMIRNGFVIPWEKNASTRASKRASRPASKNAPSETETETDSGLFSLSSERQREESGCASAAQLSVEEIRTRWNAIPGIKPCDAIEEDFRKRMNALRKEHRNPEWWEKLFSKVAASPFLSGKVPGKDGKKPFTASLPWLVGRINLGKVLAGNYNEMKAASMPKLKVGGL